MREIERISVKLAYFSRKEGDERDNIDFQRAGRKINRQQRCKTIHINQVITRLLIRVLLMNKLQYEHISIEWTITHTDNNE